MSSRRRRLGRVAGRAQKLNALWITDFTDVVTLMFEQRRFMIEMKI